MMDRAGHLLGIHKKLRLLFSKNRDLAYSWMKTRNKAFKNKSPMEVIGDYGFAGLLLVRSILNKAASH